MAKDLLSLLGMLAVVLLVLMGAYLFTRWAGKGGLLTPYHAAPCSGQLQILDRLPLGKEQWLLVVRVGSRYFLLSSAPSGVSLVAELAAEEGALWHSPSSHDGSSRHLMPEFDAILKRLRDKKES